MQTIFHPRTKQQLEMFFEHPSHAVLLTGPEGSGKFFTANLIATKLSAEPFIVAPAEEKSVITIDQIRELYNFTKTGSKAAIVIKDAQMLGLEAQNAFLKLLEEPPKNTTFILTALRPDSLLSTIQSRLQHIAVVAPRADDLATFTKDAAFSSKNLLITSGGLTGAYISIATDSEAHQQHQHAIDAAKKFYAETIYQRHLLCIENKYEKQWAQELIKFLAVIVQTLLQQSSANPDVRSKLLKQAELLETTSKNLFQLNGNPKIHLAKLCEQLG